MLRGNEHDPERSRLGQIIRRLEPPDYIQVIRRYCVPLQAIAPDVNPASKTGLMIVGGSAFLWESLEGRFFVTAEHVWNDLSALVEDGYHLFTYDKDGPTLLHKPELVDSCKELDLAVFTINGIRDLVLSGKEFLRTSIWPPAMPGPTEVIWGCGYPRAARRVFRDRRIGYGLLSFAYREWNFLRNETLIRLDAAPGYGLKVFSDRNFAETFAENSILPGLSGAPLFVFRQSPFWEVHWVGTVQEGADVPPDGHVLIATCSSLVTSAGQILPR